MSTSGYVMRAVGFENGVPCPHAGEWLESFDHDADGGRGTPRSRGVCREP